MKKLDKRQKKFAEEYALTENAYQSALTAGYSETYAKTHSHKILDNCEIKKLIEKLKVKVEEVAEEKFKLSAEKVLSDIEEIKQRCMQKKPVMVFDKVEKEYVQETDTDGEGIWTFEANAALKACELQGKHLKMFTDKLELGAEDGRPTSIRIKVGK